MRAAWALLLTMALAACVEPDAPASDETMADPQEGTRPVPLDMAWQDCSIGVLLAYDSLDALQEYVPAGWQVAPSGRAGVAVDEGYFELAIQDCDDHHLATAAIHVLRPGFADDLGPNGHYYVFHTWGDDDMVAGLSSLGWNATPAELGATFSVPSDARIDGVLNFQGAAGAPLTYSEGALYYWHQGSHGPVLATMSWDTPVSFAQGLITACQATGFPGSAYANDSCLGQDHYQVTGELDVRVAPYALS